MAVHRVGALVQQPVVEAFVVAVVEPLLLQGPFEVPVGLGDEQEVGVALADLGDRVRPEVLGRCRARPFAPGLREHVGHQQHGHVAAHAVRLVGDRGEGVDGRRAQLVAEGVELDDVRPGREVGVAASGEDLAAGLQEGGGVAGQVVGGALDQAAGAFGQPGVVGGDVVGDVVEDQPDATGGQLGAGSGQSLGTAEGCVHHVVPDAVRRAGHVLRAEVGQRGPERLLERGVAQRDLQPGGAAFPHAHQPDGVDARGRDLVPGGLRYSPRVTGWP
jgi:hypothetical protein